MSKRIRWRVLLIVLVVAGLVAGYVATGYSHAQKEWLGPGSPPLSEALKKGIKLGLDLRGGIHLVLQVNTADAVKAERDDAVEQLQTQAREQTVALGAIEYPSVTSFTVTITPQTDEKKLDEDPVGPLPRDQGLGHAELVHAVADRLHGLRDRVLLGLAAPRVFQGEAPLPSGRADVPVG